MKAPLEFRIQGMDCADEVAILRRENVLLVGSPDRLGFDILRDKMLIAPGTPVITADQIVRVVGRTGMRAEPWQDVRPGAAEAGHQMAVPALRRQRNHLELAIDGLGPQTGSTRPLTRRLLTRSAREAREHGPGW